MVHDKIDFGMREESMETEYVKAAEDFVRKTLGQDATGHDWYHIDRVRKNALYIWKLENSGGNAFVIEMAALLHDIPDGKLNESEEAGLKKLQSFFDGLSLNAAVVEEIITIISSISYKGGRAIQLPSQEAKIVQDADRLDAIGAIGIARAFAYGGKKGQALFDPSIDVRLEMTLEQYRNGKSSTINHFYEKLLKLKDGLHTDTAKQMAEKRHQFMERFLQEFYNEWNGQS
jgi:uncharacterized protein